MSVIATWTFSQVPNLVLFMQHSNPEQHEHKACEHASAEPLEHKKLETEVSEPTCIMSFKAWSSGLQELKTPEHPEQIPGAP